jgi:hypothetical protein
MSRNACEENTLMRPGASAGVPRPCISAMDMRGCFLDPGFGPGVAGFSALILLLHVHKIKSKNNTQIRKSALEIVFFVGLLQFYFS